MTRYFKSETVKTGDLYIKQVSVYNNGQYQDQFTYTYDRPGITNSVRFWLTCLTRYPRLVCKSYFENYAIICNLYRFPDPRNWEIIEKDVRFTSAAENFYIGCMNKVNVMGTMVYNQQYKDTLDVPSTSQYIQRTDTNIFLGIIYKNQYIKLGKCDLFFCLILFLCLCIVFVGFHVAETPLV